MFSERLKTLRKSRGMSLDKLADALNAKYDTKISKSMLSRWENGADPQMSYVRIIADYFNIEPDEIINPISSKEERNIQESIDKKIAIVDERQKFIDNTNYLMKSLSDDRLGNVYNYTEQQYNEQNNIIEMPELEYEDVELHGAVSAGTGEYLLDNQTELVPYDGVVPEHDYAVVVNGVSMRPLFEDKQIIFVKKTFEARSGQVVIAYYDNQAYVKKYVNDEKGVRFVSLNKSYDDMTIDETHETHIIGVVVL
ncbi:helix-turn-helix domain-containing protein [Leuconostoc pseudomesenteroides]|uniref:helix-turn-helix domain-containing protein n=1 Tax=Leuconostoc pseudomesenteroides TaxID=33968 RepID=UPI0032DEF9FB